MAQVFTWGVSPSGVYKNNAMSRQLRYASIETTEFLQFVRTEPGYGRGRGESITITRTPTLVEPDNPRLNEDELIPEDAFALNTRGITVTEFGRAVTTTWKADLLSVFNLNDPVQRVLRDQMGLSLDTAAAQAFKDTQLRYVPTDANGGNTFTTNGVFGAQATVPISVPHLENMRDILFDTYHISPYEGNNYVGIFRTRSIRGIKDDSQYEEWQKYTDPSNKFNSEVGRWEQTRLLETNHAKALANVGNNSVCGEGVVFGVDPVGSVEAQTPELRMEIAKNFGRFVSVAWYGVLEYGSVWGDSANAGEANIIYVGST